MKTWIIYFSRAGGNWVDGGIRNLEKGNTEIVAEKIHSLIKGELFSIRMVHPYSTDYIPCTEEAKKDQEADRRPPILTPLPRLEKGDIVYLGYPIYWETMPMPVLTFLDSYDSLEGITIYPFVTHEGSGLGTSLSFLRHKAKGAKILSPLPIPGSVASRSDPLLKEWINSHSVRSI